MSDTYRTIPSACPNSSSLSQGITTSFAEKALSISATTRNIRPGEVDGIHYFYKTREEFEEMIKNNELLEYAEFVGNYYGTPKQFVLDKIKEGQNVLLEIEMQGALQIKKIYNEAILVFFMTKDAKTQKERLISRGRDSKEDIDKRLKQTIIDAGFAKDYDYVLVNENLEDSINDIVNIVNGTYDKSKNENNLKLLDKLVSDIKEENYVWTIRTRVD